MNPKRNFILIFTLTLFSSISLFSQQNINNQTVDSAILKFKGQLIDDEGNFISFAHIVNFKRDYATISDSLGKFRMPVIINDSIRISAIGFETKFISIKKQNIINDSINLKIVFRRKTYNISEVNIYQLRWLVFKAEFMAEKVIEDKVTTRLTEWLKNLIPASELLMMDKAVRGSSLQFNYMTKREKQKEKVAYLVKKYRIIQPKFNDKLIQDVTGLSGTDIYKFINYCNFREGFLLNASEYQIIDKIQNCWKEYKIIMADDINKL
ncbi:MAG: hypothetical protein JXR51_10000 [Bacteroidales bacterium]|nr:hypothetical protein [Bacteroidales bacterium]